MELPDERYEQAPARATRRWLVWLPAMVAMFLLCCMCMFATLAAVALLTPTSVDLTFTSPRLQIIAGTML